MLDLRPSVVHLGDAFVVTPRTLAAFAWLEHPAGVRDAGATILTLDVLAIIILLAYLVKLNGER